MTAEELAAIHRRAMTVPRSWDAETFRGFLSAPGSILATCGQGFALGRVIVDEAELLTLAVDPDHQRQGLGRQCLKGFEDRAHDMGATRTFLEVSGENRAAISLYGGAGYARSGLRKGYYRGPDGTRIDAILMEKSLHRG